MHTQNGHRSVCRKVICVATLFSILKSVYLRLWHACTQFPMR